MIHIVMIIQHISKKNMKFIITSQSPYAIKALIRYAEEKKITSIAIYDFNSDRNHHFHEVTDNLEVMWKSFAEPMYRIM